MLKRKVDRIPQSLLVQFQLISSKYTQLGVEFRRLEAEKKRISEEIIDRMKRGALPEPGALQAEIEFFGRYPSWKEEFIKRCGIEEADKVIQATPYSERLKVSMTE